MLKRVMKITSTAFDALFTPELSLLSQLFKENDYEIRMAGGAVRDLLMGLKPSDVDFASTATPTQMKALFERHDIRMLNKRGEEHGTITCRINDKENFEITTLRIDVVCDGRRAEVQFTTDWAKDAFRRDLTVNSLFLGLDGTVYDYTGGIKDIERRRVVFVGDPVQRLQEDYLRILRYFRFFGRIAWRSNEHELTSIDAIIACREGLKNVSGERIWTELHKILVGRFAADVVAEMMGRCGLGPFVGLDGFRSDANDSKSADRIVEFQRIAAANLSAADGKLVCQPATALAALLANSDEALAFRDRVKFSNAEHDICAFVVAHRDKAFRRRDDLKYFKHLILDIIFEDGQEIKEQARSRCIELLKYVGASELERQIIDWPIDVFPISGMALMERDVPKGPRVRAVSRHLYNLWKRSDLAMTVDELLTHVNDADVDAILEDMQQQRIAGPKRKRRRV